MKYFSPQALDSIFKYSGLIGVVLFFLFLIFKSSIDKRFFSTLTQKRKTIIILTSLSFVWIIGVLLIVLNYLNGRPAIPRESGPFIYSGQIVDEQGMPLSNAFAYVILGRDTIEAESRTGRDGTFAIRLDTAEGIQATLYFGHTKYGTDSRFRTLMQSVPEQFLLKQVHKPNQEVNAGQTGQYSSVVMQVSSPNRSIEYGYDKAGLDSFDGRYRYLGGRAYVYVNKVRCYESQHFIPPTHAAGSTRADLERQLNISVKEIFKKERYLLNKTLAVCANSDTY